MDKLTKKLGNCEEYILVFALIDLLFLGPVFSYPDTLKRAFKAWPASHSVKLKCNAKGTPPLKYTWLKDGELLKGRRLDPYLNTSIWYLKLKDLVPKDAGQYTCIVSNRYGSINHTYTVRVLGKNTAAYLRLHCRLVVHLSTDSRFLRQFNAHS